MAEEPATTPPRNRALDTQDFSDVDEDDVHKEPGKVVSGRQSFSVGHLPLNRSPPPPTHHNLFFLRSIFLLHKRRLARHDCPSLQGTGSSLLVFRTTRGPYIFLLPVYVWKESESGRRTCRLKFSVIFPAPERTSPSLSLTTCALRSCFSCHLAFVSANGSVPGLWHVITSVQQKETINWQRAGSNARKNVVKVEAELRGSERASSRSWTNINTKPLVGTAMASPSCVCSKAKSGCNS